MPAWLEHTIQDLRYALRGLRRNPAFALTAILAAAIAIGATTAVFSAVDRILFRPLPYRDEARIVSVGMMAPLDTNEFFFADAYFDLRRNPGPFAAVTSFQAGAIACDLTEQQSPAPALPPRRSQFPRHSRRPPRRRTLLLRRRGPPQRPARRHDLPRLWRSRFAADPAAIGKNSQHRRHCPPRHRRTAGRFRHADPDPRRHSAPRSPR